MSARRSTPAVPPTSTVRSMCHHGLCHFGQYTSTARLAFFRCTARIFDGRLLMKSGVPFALLRDNKENNHGQDKQREAAE